MIIDFWFLFGFACSAMVAVFLLWVWVLRVKECPQWVQRQRVVDLLVVPFFFVLLPHSGQLGRLVVIL